MKIIVATISSEAMVCKVNETAAQEEKIKIKINEKDEKKINKNCNVLARRKGGGCMVSSCV